MDKSKEIGVVFENLRRFEWKIEDFRSLFEDRTAEYRSPIFWACQNKYVMVLSLHDVVEEVDVVNIQLFRKSYLDEERVEISVGIKKADGTDLVLRTKTQILTDGQVSMNKLLIAEHADLEDHEEEWMSEGALTIYWDMCVDYPDFDRESQENMDDDWESLDEEYVEEDYSEVSGNLEKESCLCLQQDMLAMLENGVDTDIMFLVGDSKFKAHQCILIARSRFFQRHLVEEQEIKDSPRFVEVKFDDLRPSDFRKFLEFAYTGNIRSLTVQSAVVMFSLGHSFECPDLRIWSSKFIYDNITPSVVIDILLQDLEKHQKLYYRTMRMFEKHTTEVLEGESWRKLLTRIPDAANDIIESSGLPSEIKEPIFEIIRQKRAEEKRLKADLVTENFMGRHRVETKNVTNTIARKLAIQKRKKK